MKPDGRLTAALGSFWRIDKNLVLLARAVDEFALILKQESTLYTWSTAWRQSTDIKAKGTLVGGGVDGTIPCALGCEPPNQGDRCLGELQNTNTHTTLSEQRRVTGHRGRPDLHSPINLVCRPRPGTHNASVPGVSDEQQQQQPAAAAKSLRIGAPARISTETRGTKNDNTSSHS